MKLSTLIGKFIQPYIDPIKNAVIELRQVADTLTVTMTQQVHVSIYESAWTPDVSSAHNLNAYSVLESIVIGAPKSFGQNVQGNITICIRNGGTGDMTLSFDTAVSCPVSTYVIPMGSAAVLRMFCTGHKGEHTGTFVSIDGVFTPVSVVPPE